MSDQLIVSPVAVISEDDLAQNDLPYNLFLWNDPITPMIIVTRVLKKLFGYSGEKAEQLMLIAHNEGKVIVFTGEKPKAESYCVKLHAAGLQATIAKDS